ncbi:hypothetical protein C4566_01930 [Candidatus Parcubacteria bacterium]|nr:MAG: hypothetical protein C4566_01930 [Candidatus Parcubacteria bacterium]
MSETFLFGQRGQEREKYMNRKNLMIREFQGHVRRLNENMDYDSKVLQDRFRTVVLGLLTEEQLAKVVEKGLSE